MTNFFPEIASPTKSSTGMCAVVFEELDAAVSLLRDVRGEFNPFQQMVVGRFLMACKVFGQEMLLAESSPDALSASLGLPLHKKNVDNPQPQLQEQDLISSMCTEVCGDLERIGRTVQSELLTGITEVIESISTSHDFETLEIDTLHSMSSSIRNLAAQIASLFEMQPYVLQRQYLAYQSMISDNDTANDSPLRVTAEEFMLKVKPPERKPTLRDRMQPFIPELKRLRQDGYTYAQCAQFLEQNGLKTYIGSISSIMNEFR
ncbi:hypothetical protein ACQZ2G_07575 [Pseudomonas viridiflava]|uniref:hypothetical protein n=1 Tax=Pseudomonas viridiflava TaxID=33069 RepID=UPI000F02420F|nr:hypothetical protein [Pseudomonas viridiflava]